MNIIKFKIVNSTTKEVIGFEYLTPHGWKNDVFDYGERDGVFDQQELGDGFLGIIERKQFINSINKYGEEIYDGDDVEGISEKMYKVEWNSGKRGWVLMTMDTVYDMNALYKP